MMKSVLIAGCGYLGNRIGQRLGSQKFDVHTITRSGARESMAWNNYRLNLFKKGSLSVLPRKVDVLIYTVSPSGPTTQAYRDCYEKGLENLANYYANSEPGVVLLATSTRVYAENSGGWVDEDNAEMNQADEKAAFLLAAEQGNYFKGMVSMRLSGIYGKGRTRFLQSVQKHTARKNTGAADYSNRIHVEDAARAAMFLIENEQRPPAINITDDRPEDRSVVIQWLADQMQLENHFETYKLDQPKGKRVSNSMLKKMGFSLRFPTYQEGYLPMMKSGSYE